MAIVTQGKTISSSAQINPGTVLGSDIADDTITNANVNSAAAIAMSKLTLAITNAEVAAGAAIVDTKLAAISTAGKVSGAALTSLSSIPSGAGVIPAVNLPGVSDSEVWVPAGVFQVGSNLTRGVKGTDASFDCMLMADAGTSNLVTNVRVPSGKTSISSIKLVYYNETTTATIRFNSIQASLLKIDGSAQVNDSDGTNDDFVTGGTLARLGVITLSASRYSSITSVAADDILCVNIQRAGADAADTYGKALAVLGVKVTFA